MDSSNLTLSTLYFFHMTASVLWMGGMLLVYLDNRRISGQDPTGKVDAGYRKRLFLTGWFCLAVIGATGMFQMSANENYSGFMAITNPWSQAILTKHLLILIFLAGCAYLSGFQEASLQRSAIRAQIGSENGAQLVSGQVQRENRTILILAGMFFLILVFTSLARAA